MATVLTVLQVIIALVLIVTVLLQSSKSAGMSGQIAAGAETFFGKKKSLDEKLSRLSAVFGALFLLITLIIAKMCIRDSGNDNK